MEISIIIRKFRLKPRLMTFVNGEETYQIKSENFSFDVIKLLQKQTGYLKSIITHETSILKDKFYVRLFTEDNVMLEFKRKSVWKHEYECIYNKDKYEVAYSSWDTYSVFKNDIEYIHLIKKEINFLDEEYVFKIDEINPKNLEFLISLCIFIFKKINDAANSD